jgi:2-polyprenyl-3-methyl-5-hydroxy-6-metoxy-1,4-benzoquinol methylase
VHSGPQSTDSLSRGAKSFWSEHAESAPESVGYLISDWPKALAHRRFEGEWRFVEKLLDRHRVARGRCLDVGCGPGLWLERLAGVFATVDGFDTALPMVEMAAARLARTGITNAQVAQSDLEHFVSAGGYDFIFVGGVLTYLEDAAVASAIKVFRSLLAPGGLILFRESTHRVATVVRTTPLRPGLLAPPERKPLPYFAIYRHAQEMQALFEKNGLVLCERKKNVDYKLADIAEEMLRFVNVMSGRRLARDAARAENWTERIYRYRSLGLTPAYALLHRLPLRMFRLENHWFLCRPI